MKMYKHTITTIEGEVYEFTDSRMHPAYDVDMGNCNMVMFTIKDRHISLNPDYISKIVTVECMKIAPREDLRKSFVHINEKPITSEPKSRDSND